jgi:hypothetical protein
MELVRERASMRMEPVHLSLKAVLLRMELTGGRLMLCILGMELVYMELRMD